MSPVYCTYWHDISWQYLNFSLLEQKHEKGVYKNLFLWRKGIGCLNILKLWKSLFDLIFVWILTPACSKGLLQYRSAVFTIVRGLFVWPWESGFHAFYERTYHFWSNKWMLIYHKLFNVSIHLMVVKYRHGNKNN